MLVVWQNALCGGSWGGLVCSYIVLVLLHKYGSGYMMVAYVERCMFNQLWGVKVTWAMLYSQIFLPVQQYFLVCHCWSPWLGSLQCPWCTLLFSAQEADNQKWARPHPPMAPWCDDVRTALTVRSVSPTKLHWNTMSASNVRKWFTTPVSFTYIFSCAE